MKKLLAIALTAGMTVSLFAADIFTYAPLTGNIKSYTETEFSIASKFGNYFRTPSVKYGHIFDENNKETELNEMTPRDTVINKTVSVYDDDGNLIEQSYTNSDGDLIWKSTISYKDGVKVDLSEYDSKENLKDRTIYTYENNLLVDETSYTGEGALVWKTIYKYNTSGKLDTISDYSADGKLSEQKKYAYNETGALDTITYYDNFTGLQTQEVFRYGTNNVLNEITTYDNAKRVTKRVLIKYDTTGNVNKVSEYEVSEKFGTTVNELTAMSEYVYEY